MLIAQEIIRKKRDKMKLNSEEIKFMVKGYVDGSIPDYQMSSLAMSIFLNGFDAEETACLLNSMIASGIKYDWSKYKGQRLFVDKHSTGGVGDKTSLVILPLLVAEGLDVPMISGRGLGHTGGTLDKLESMPGFKTRVDTPTYYNWMEKFHAGFGAQTEEFVPADKRLYALRDVTATVESRALITASIMSKKIAEGLDALVLDVKFGSGAFMNKYDDAKLLANSLVEAGRAANCQCVAALTNMDEPLGDMAGNSLEVAECLDILQGKGPMDTKDLSIKLAAAVALTAHKKNFHSHFDDYCSRMQKHLDSGRAFEIFSKIAVNQGANIGDIERKNTAWITGDAVKREIRAQRAGYVSAIETRNLGIAILELGGGRKRTDDIINPFVGISAMKKVGDKVEAGEPLCVLHVSPKKDSSQIEDFVKNSYTVVNEAAGIAKFPLIKEWII